MRSTLIACALSFIAASSFAQTTIRLYPGAAPGSENWSLPEATAPGSDFLPNGRNLGNWIFNVSVPTLTIFRADPSKSNGTAVIVAPGGAFHFLAETEGEPLARWLQERGITAFVLKYRVVQTTPEHRKQLFAGMPAQTVDPEVPAIMPLDLADAREALKYVRAHANELGIELTRVGVLGASAGAMIAVSLITRESDGPKPDFIAALFPGLNDWMRPVVVPKSAPPAFFAVASDDNFGFAPANTELYNAWVAAGRSAELHAYAAGGHGFDLQKRGLPVDTWTDRFEDWLRFQKLLPARPR